MTLSMDGMRDIPAGSMPKTGPPPGAGLSDWVGRKETVTGCVPVTSAIAIHATLSRPYLDCPAAGDPMPALWHWYAFPSAVGTCDLAADGHPRLGGFLPPVPYERRMWASGRLQFLGDLVVGEEIEKTSTITSIEEKSGSAGGMVFVEVEHELRGRRGLAVRESQTIVYLPIAPEFSPPPRKMAPTRDLVIDIRQPVSTALLFRYSAITFNAHRIHYDLPYARQVEHYPGLVVHGPLQANLLLAEATAWKGRRPDRFSFRGVHPMFQGADIHLRATQAGTGRLDMCTVAAAGHICMQSKAEWED
ncbi:FAS1-like dehydratase domain-containing protein [Ruegeria marina]|uniref:3-methylfumaryl-CoA hydratase n=1 Tax=Ruegeria marina TaxID=639004 RepID=A0A1G7E0I1_9RHOB|nr:MaoC family dehydratase N-terminal domain-containing protein [Ruegeria marina]SDE57219.1 3-methylfumaryl-CoA hydratase [Ruegeria marina]